MADGDDHRKRVRLSKAERRERLAELVLRRTKLSESEVALLWEVFPEIVVIYQGAVWRYLKRHGVDEEGAKDAAQDVFMSLHRKIVDEGFPASMRAKLYSLAKGASSNRLRGQERDPASACLPSSSSEPPRTPRDLDRAVDLERVAPQLLSLLTDPQRDVVELVLIEKLSHSEAADVLVIALGTVKSRVMAAKHRMLELLEQLLPPSQRRAT